MPISCPSRPSSGFPPGLDVGNGRRRYSAAEVAREPLVRLAFGRAPGGRKTTAVGATLPLL
jgi:hypothetical protein